MRWLAVCALLVSPALLTAGDWGQLEFLIGQWAGQGAGQPGAGAGKFSFEPDLQGRILVRKSFADYPPTEGKPAYRHDDLLVVYRETPKGAWRAIYFDNEGHVIRYSVQAEKKRAVFTSDGRPNEERYRMTYTSTRPDQLSFRFEVGGPGKDLMPYIEAVMRRE